MEIFFIVFLKIIMENYTIFFNIPNTKLKRKVSNIFTFENRFFGVRFYAL